eukprot:1590087-Rhodomonas_salina.1
MHGGRSMSGPGRTDRWTRGEGRARGGGHTRSGAEERRERRRRSGGEKQIGSGSRRGRRRSRRWWEELEEGVTARERGRGVIALFREELCRLQARLLYHSAASEPLFPPVPLRSRLSRV